MRSEIDDVFSKAACDSNTHSPFVKSIVVQLHLSENTYPKAPYIGMVSRIKNWVGVGVELKWIIANDTDEQTVRMLMGKPILGLVRAAFKTFEIAEGPFLKSLSAYPGWSEVIASLSPLELEYYETCASSTTVSMDEEAFWAVFEPAKSATSNDEREAIIIAELSKLPPEDIAEFSVIFHIKMAEAYRHDLWAIAYIVNGGCSDDGFTYFRAWLICQGRDFYNQALARVEFVGEQVPVEAADYKSPNRAMMEFDLVPAGVYKEKTGHELYYEGSEYYSRDPLGTPWSDEDLPLLYPSIYKKFE